MSDWNQRIIEEFRANEGKVGGHFAKTTLLLLHTTGARSGKPRVNPLVTFSDGDALVVVASKGGAPSHPDWYHNVVANPDVTVEYGTERFRARAEVVPEPERSKLYERMESELDSFSEYKKTAQRTIPVIRLTRQE